MDSLSYKTVSANKKTIKKEWVIIDAQNQALGRVASVVAMILRGKHKPTFTPHADCGDHVIVINASGITLSGKKWTDREYVRYSGYPGGQRTTTPKEIFEKDPARLLENSVKGMLPKNRIGSKIFNNLHVYNGSEHKHEAQKPKNIDITTIK